MALLPIRIPLGLALLPLCLLLSLALLPLRLSLGLARSLPLSATLFLLGLHEASANEMHGVLVLEAALKSVLFLLLGQLVIANDEKF